MSARSLTLASMLCLLPAASWAGEADARFQKKLEASAASATLRDASWGVSVRSADTGQPIGLLDAEKNLVPASTLKLLVTAAAMSLLGEGHRFTTRVYAGGAAGPDGVLRSDLIVAGGGDPTLGSTLVKGSRSMDEVLLSWIDGVRRAGIRRIEGGIAADNRLHSGIPIPGSWSWEDVGNYYAAPADALSINDNLYKIVFAPGKPGEAARVLRTEPEVFGLKLVNMVQVGPKASGDQGYVFSSPGQYVATLRGTVPADREEFAIRGALPEPALFAAQALKARLEKEGIPVSGNARLREPSARAETGSLVAETVSPPLKDIVLVTHKRSFNLYAEMLARALAVRRGKPGTIADGLDAVREFLREAGVDVSGLKLLDTCGMSRYSLVRADTLTRVLALMAKDRAFPAWLDSLVVPGDAEATGHIRRFGAGELKGSLWIKSGSMTGVRSYSGYLKTRKGKLLAFAFIVNNYSRSPAEIEELHEKLLAELLRL